MNKEIQEVVEENFSVSNVKLITKMLEVVDNDLSGSEKKSRLGELDYIISQAIK